MKKTIFLIVILAMTLSIFALPTFCIAQENGAEVAYSEYIADFDSGCVLGAHNENSKHEIASMVKIMTANIVFEEIEKGAFALDDKIVVSSVASGMGGSQMFLDANSEYKVSDLLKGIIVVSANDASVAMAEKIAGSQDAFVNIMNERAQSWGMTNTKFVNATGLPSAEEQFSTAKDVNIMTRKLMSHDKYYQFAKIWLEDFVHPSGRVTQLANTNKLIRFYNGCVGGKTGYTDKAGFCLSACAMRNDLKVVATVVGVKDSKTRFAKVTKMFDSAFATYKNKIVYKSGEKMDSQLTVRNSPIATIDVTPQQNVAILEKNGAKLTDIRVEMNENMRAPIAKNDVVGKIIISTADGEKTINLLSMIDAPKSTYLDWLRKIALYW
ncbi:MAG: D-alanyl-D-alanine carboxypeptidase family protein [Clostridia bacterium]